MAHAWQDFEGPAAMALAGRYDLCTKQEPSGRFRWWVSTATGWWTVRQGMTDTMDEAKAAAESAHADVMAYATGPILSPLEVAAILAAQAEDAARANPPPPTP